MKNKTVSKLHKNRGASILLAILIFLLCALAGASALIMASSNAGRYSHTSEQRYYSVSSAALMMVDLLEGLKYASPEVKYIYTREWEYTGEPASSGTSSAQQHTTSESYTLTLPATGTKGTLSSASLVSKIKDANSSLKLCNFIQIRCDELVPVLNIPGEWYTQGEVEKIELAENRKSVSYDFSITVPGRENTFGTVKAKLVMHENYDLVLTFVGMTDDGESKEYAITLYWHAEVTPEQTTSNPVYTYAEPDPDKKNPDGTPFYKKGTMVQERTLTVGVRWRKENVTISRGEAINE